MKERIRAKWLLQDAHADTPWRIVRLAVSRGNLIMVSRYIDLASLQKARSFYESAKDRDLEPGTVDTLLAIHKHIFDGLYDHAGKVRKLNLSKGNFRFAGAMYLEDTLKIIDRMPDSTFEEIIKKYVEINVAHPFMEGNGRSGRIWLDVLLRARLGMVVDWAQIPKAAYLPAMERSPVNDLEIMHLLKNALTGDWDNRKIIFKGLEQSYYYEGIVEDSYDGDGYGDSR